MRNKADRGTGEERYTGQIRYTRQSDYYGEDYDRRTQIDEDEDVRYTDGRRVRGTRAENASSRYSEYHRSDSTGRERYADAQERDGKGRYGNDRRNDERSARRYNERGDGDSRYTERRSRERAEGDRRYTERGYGGRNSQDNRRYNEHGEDARQYADRRYADRRDGRYVDGRYADDRRDGRYVDERYADDRRGGRYVAPRRKKRHTGRNILMTILVILLALVGVAYAYLGRMDRTTLSNLITNSSVSLSGYRNLVFYGVDSRDGSMTLNTHSDTIIICSINQKTGEVRLVSVYRDTYLDNTNGEYRKATECYFYGGPERSINMLNKNLDLDISDYVTIDFSGVITIIDALGGIDLEITDEEMTLINGYCVENKEVTGVDYTPLTSSGYVHLDGIQALAYCRIRYTEGWDYKRTERQRTVMNLCFQKASSLSLTSLPSLVNDVLPHLSTSLSNLELISLASGISGYSLGSQTGFPFDKSTADLTDAGDVVVPVTLASNVTQLHEFLFDVSGYTPSDTVQEISNTIINNTGIS